MRKSCRIGTITLWSRMIVGFYIQTLKKIWKWSSSSCGLLTMWASMSVNRSSKITLKAQLTGLIKVALKKKDTFLNQWTNTVKRQSYRKSKNASMIFTCRLTQSEIWQEFWCKKHEIFKKTHNFWIHSSVSQNSSVSLQKLQTKP